MIGYIFAALAGLAVGIWLQWKFERIMATPDLKPEPAPEFSTEWWGLRVAEAQSAGFWMGQAHYHVVLNLLGLPRETTIAEALDHIEKIQCGVPTRVERLEFASLN